MRVILVYQLSWLLVNGHPCLFPDVDSCRVMSIIKYINTSYTQNLTHVNSQSGMQLFPTLTPADVPVYPSAALRATFWRSMREPRRRLTRSGTGMDSGAGRIPGQTRVYPWYRLGTQVRFNPIVSHIRFIEFSHEMKANSCKSSTRQAQTYGSITRNFQCVMVSRRATGSMNIIQALNSMQITWPNMCCMSMKIRSEATLNHNAGVTVMSTV